MLAERPLGAERVRVATWLRAPGALGVVAALLFTVTMPPWNAGWLAPMVLGPLAWSVQHRAPRRAFYDYLSFGAGISLLNLVFAVGALKSELGPRWLLVCGLFALLLLANSLRPWLVGAGQCVLGTRLSPLLGWLGGWAVAEWCVPAPFHWELALSCHSAPLLLVPTRLLGAHGLSALIALSSWLAARSVGRSQFVWVPRLGFVALLLGWLGLGLQQRAVIARQVDRSPWVSVVVVQPGAGPEGPLGSDRFAWYRQQTAELHERSSAVLAVWPEITSPRPLRAERLEGFLGDHFPLARSEGTTRHPLNLAIMLGLALRQTTANGGQLHNSAVLVSARGNLLGTSAKRELFPVGERALSLPAWLGGTELLAPGTRFGAEGRQRTLNLSPHGKLISLLCVEDTSSELFRRLSPSEPELVVVLGSDSRFGSPQGVLFHQAIARVRAVESGRYFVRSIRAGASGVLRPNGDLAASIPIQLPGAGIVRVQFLRGRTWAVEFPYGGTFVIVGCTALWLLLGRARQARRDRPVSGKLSDARYSASAVR